MIFFVATPQFPTVVIILLVFLLCPISRFVVLTWLWRPIAWRSIITSVAGCWPSWQQLSNVTTLSVRISSLNTPHHSRHRCAVHQQNVLNFHKLHLGRESGGGDWSHGANSRSPGGGGLDCCWSHSKWFRNKERKLCQLLANLPPKQLQTKVKVSDVWRELLRATVPVELQVQDHGLAEPAIQAEPKLQDSREQEPEAVLGSGQFLRHLFIVIRNLASSQLLLNWSKVFVVIKMLLHKTKG